MEKCYRFKSKTDWTARKCIIKIQIGCKIYQNQWVWKKYKLLHRNAKMLLTTLLHNISINTAAVQTIRWFSASGNTECSRVWNRSAVWNNSKD